MPGLSPSLSLIPRKTWLPTYFLVTQVQDGSEISPTLRQDSEQPSNYLLQTKLVKSTEVYCL